MKIIAMHLPQFHRIPENDEWWGDGFTEWTNVKKAYPLFEGHRQPRIPLNSEYYDLSDPKVLLAQMSLAAEYGLDGFCFYHYWFNGRKLLEKPLEKLLKEPTIPLPFMLCWANEPWSRRWDGNKGASEILIEQNYGNKEEWQKHFEYLMQFFQRDEYIKVDGAPALCIYKGSEIVNQIEMLQFWNVMARENGFEKGIFIIQTHRQNIENEFPVYGNAVMDFEPFATLNRLYPHLKQTMLIKRTLTTGTDGAFWTIDYERFCQYLSHRAVFRDTEHYLGFFPGWDNTPRVGERVQIVFENNSPDIFEKYFSLQYKRSIENNKRFLFINAWNEWGEGAFIEPDDDYRYRYLESIKRTIKKDGRM